MPKFFIFPGAYLMHTQQHYVSQATVIFMHYFTSAFISHFFILTAN